MTQAKQPKTASKHTPGPWHWGESWKEYDTAPWLNGEFQGPKYADIALYGTHSTIIPLRIDHYEIEWNSRDGLADFTPADRRLIVKAPEMYELLERFVNLVDSHASIAEIQALHRDARRIKAEIDGEAEHGEG